MMQLTDSFEDRLARLNRDLARRGAGNNVDQQQQQALPATKKVSSKDVAAKLEQLGNKVAQRVREQQERESEHAEKSVADAQLDSQFDQNTFEGRLAKLNAKLRDRVDTNSVPPMQASVFGAGGDNAITKKEAETLVASCTKQACKSYLAEQGGLEAFCAQLENALCASSKQAEIARILTVNEFETEVAIAIQDVACEFNNIKYWNALNNISEDTGLIKVLKPMLQRMSNSGEANSASYAAGARFR